MKTKIYGLLILFLIISCALESKFGLPNDEKINTELIGIWYDGKTPNEYVIIKPSGEMKYKLILGDSTELISYSKKIKGFNILNVISDYKGTKINTFYGFELKNDTLEFSEVNKEMRKIDFNSQNELINFFNENINKNEFFINPVKLIKK
jgi:hypothetical protein